MENNINWKQKLSSRKLWAALIGIAVGIGTIFGIEENDYAQIVGVVGSIATAVTYIFGESQIDAARQTKDVASGSSKDTANG